MSNDLSKIKIAISGKSGCGNTTVSKLLAEKLNLTHINFTFRNMAAEKGIEFYNFCQMAESDSTFDLELDKKQVELASVGGCVLGSRLAIWLLKNADLKVYLYASPEVRANRIYEREGGDIEDIILRTKKRDENDNARYKKLYNLDNDKFDFADIVIDTALFKPEEILDLIENKIVEKGYILD